MGYIDLHVHIDYYNNPYKIAFDYEKREIYTIFVTNLPEIYHKHFKKFSNFKYIRLAIGYHPQLVNEFPFNKKVFKKCIESTNYIGEVGLDFSESNKRFVDKQVETFYYITQPRFNKGRLYSIHSKYAADKVLDILVKNNVSNAIFHWYNGSISTLEKIVKKGYYFSINMNMLRTQQGKNIIKHIPKKQMLHETDGPFLKIKNIIVKPSDFDYIYQYFK